jgi:hypothetical protein
MSQWDIWTRQGREAGAKERITGICTGNPYSDGSDAAKAWWTGYNAGLSNARP